MTTLTPSSTNNASQSSRDVNSEPPPLILDGISKSYGQTVVAVSDVTLTVDHGQVFGLLGPNGAGKTTVLRMLLGLVHPSAGSARLFGQRVRPGHPALRRVGALVEGPAFVPHLTGMKNLELYWRAGGQDLSSADLGHALDIAGLGSAIHRTVRSYSKGMQQRLALAQALLNKPDFFVLDEPTVGLDPQEMREIRELIRNVAAGGATVLLSSHILAEVEQVCTHAAVMSAGKLVAEGTVSDLMRATSTAYLEVDDVDRALAVLSKLENVTAEREGKGLAVSLDGLERSRLVAALVGAGVGVETIAPRHQLEDAYFEIIGGATDDSR